MFTATVDIDPAAVKRLEELFDFIEKETPLVAADQVRRAGIYICKSLAVRTPTAPKRIPPREYRAIPSPNPPRYLTYYSKKSDHGRKGRRPHPLRRWQLTRKIGTPAENAYDYYVYTDAYRGKGGKMIGKNTAQEKKELLQFHGKIRRHGLAKKSWGWIAHQIYAQDASGFGDLSYKRTKGERRDPRAAARGAFEQQRNSAMVKIANKLDYIGAIIPTTMVNDAFMAAVKKLEYNVGRTYDMAVTSAGPRLTGFQRQVAESKGWFR